MSAQDVRRLGAGATLIGGAIATAMMLGTGAAHAAPGNDITDITSTTSSPGLGWLWADVENLLGDPATSGSATTTNTNSTDPLSTAVTDFTDAKTALAGIDSSDAPSDLQPHLSQIITDQTNLLNTTVQVLNDYVAPVESKELADTGPLSSMINQWIFEPLNQSWLTDAEDMLTADKGLAGAIAGGSESDITTAMHTLAGADLTFLPTMFESIPFIFFGVLEDGPGDTAIGTDFVDLPSGL